jgi:hypothetical protein
MKHVLVNYLNDKWHDDKKCEKTIIDYLKLTWAEYGDFLVDNNLPRFYIFRYIFK